MRTSTFILIKFILVFSAALISCQAEIPSRKINGLSLVASRDSLKMEHLEKLSSINANSVALMPFGFISNMKEPKIYFNQERQWFGERKDGIELAISLLQEKGFKIMLKPQLWIRNGEFTGDLMFTSESDWKKFEKSYQDYILLYASIASKYDLEMFCIGTELFNFVEQRPQFWKNLIAEIRKNYNGKLVYAENWDKVDKTNIWKELDYIGVDAYFPLSKEIAPNLEEIREGWIDHKDLLKELSSEYKIPVLFTEYGYRNVDYALKEPWNSDREIKSINHNLQARALAAIYEEFWTENWFAGGFLWKWHQRLDSGGLGNNRFTPQNKPAENVVRDYYKRFRN